MPMCTYLSDSEFTQKVSNEHLQELLEEINKKHKFRLEEKTIKQRFKKERKEYVLYHETIYPEFQVINHYCENSESSINPCVSADIISAYFYGILKEKK